MNTFASKSGFSPSVAVLSSQGAENVANRNNLSFTEMLSPFSSAKVEFRDPNSRVGSITLSVDFKDLKRDGYLLSLTVLPSVLQEVVKLNETNSSTDVWDSCFVHSFYSWLEPADHDFLRAYLACIFVISSEDQNPLGEMDTMINQQNLQQHGSDSSSLQTPAFCSPPKWFLVQPLKHYVVIHDVSRGNKEQAERIVKSIKDKYGICTFLEINSEQDVNLPDVWKHVNARRLGLKNGLELARREILASRSPNGLPAEPAKPEVKECMFGKCLSQEDRANIQKFTQGFITESLVPYVSKQMQLLNEAIVSRRGLGKSFTNMRKWLNVATASPVLNVNVVNYNLDSTEMQARRLADLAFLFGAYPFAFQLYQSLKKDFLNDQAWLQHAGTLEMAAITSYLSGASNGKNFPMHYIENSLNYYLKTSVNPLLFFRSMLLSTRLLEALDRPQDAANFLARFIPTTNLNDLFKAVSLEHSATLYGRARMFRKQSFYRFLASTYYFQVKLDVIATRLLESVLDEISNKRWSAAEDHLLEELCKELGEKDKDMAKECLEKLLRSEGCSRLEDQSAINFSNYLRLCNGIEVVDLVVPELSNKPPRIYYLNQDLLSRKEYDQDEWKELYEKSIFKLKQHNPAVKQPLGIPSVLKAPVNEPVYVEFGLINKFTFPILLENVTLNVKTNAEVECHLIQRVELPAINPEEEDNTTVVKLAFTPKSVDNLYEVVSISCQLSDIRKTATISGIIPIWLDGNGEKPDIYKVKTDKLAWPYMAITMGGVLCEEYQVIPLQLYCGQVARTDIVIQNPVETAATLLLTADSMNEFGITVDDKNVESAGGCFKVLPRQKLQLGILVLASGTVISGKKFKVLLTYCSAHGAVRNHMIEFVITTEPLLKTNIRVIEKKSGLCALTVKNVAPSTRTFSQVEALNLAFKSNDKEIEKFLGLEKLSNRPVVLETEQEDTFCFKLNANDPSSSKINFKEIPRFVKDWPEYESTTETTVYFELLWKARITCEQGTTVTLHGRNRIPNPFINLYNDEREVITSFMCPKILLRKSLGEKTSEIHGLEGRFKLSEADIAVLSEDILQGVHMKDPKIPWDSKYEFA